MGERFSGRLREDGSTVGLEGRGTGKNIYARVVEDNGKLARDQANAGSALHPRDGWPRGRRLGPETGWLVGKGIPSSRSSALVRRRGRHYAASDHDGMPPRYAYDVDLRRRSPRTWWRVFRRGRVCCAWQPEPGASKIQRGLPPMASESRSSWAGTVPSCRRLSVSHAVARALVGRCYRVVKVVDHPYLWDYSGTTGTFVAPARVLFVTLSPEEYA